MSARKKFFTFLRYLILFALLGAAVYFLNEFFTNRKTVSYEVPIKGVTIITPEKGNLEKSLTFPGFIESDAMVPIVPFVNGTVQEYLIKAGDTVQKDQIIAKIDDSPYRLQQAQAEAAYLGYSSSFEKVEALYKSGAATKQNYDTLKAQTEAAKAQLELADLQLSYTDVKASIDGVVIMAPSAVGSIGTTSQPLAVLADLESLIINLEIPERYYSIFSKNRDKLKIKVIRTGQASSEEVVSTASIDSLSPYIKPDSKSFTLKIKLEDNITEFKPGMYVKVNIDYESREDVYCLPQRVKKSDGSVYFIENNIAHTLTLNSLFETNDYFEVDKKYKDTSFILTGQNTILDGERVNIIEGK